MLFDVIRVDGLTPVLTDLILGHADVKVMEATINVPSGFQGNMPPESVRVVDGMLSQEQILRLSECYTMHITQRKDKHGNDFVIYSFNHGCM